MKAVLFLTLILSNLAGLCLAQNLVMARGHVRRLRPMHNDALPEGARDPILGAAMQSRRGNQEMRHHDRHHRSLEHEHERRVKMSQGRSSHSRSHKRQEEHSSKRKPRKSTRHHHMNSKSHHHKHHHKHHHHESGSDSSSSSSSSSTDSRSSVQSTSKDTTTPSSSAEDVVPSHDLSESAEDVVSARESEESDEDFKDEVVEKLIPVVSRMEKGDK